MKYFFSVLVSVLVLGYAQAGNASHGFSKSSLAFNPCVVVVPISNMNICDGTNVALTVFNSAPVGATYTWTNSEPSIGLAAAGAGDLPAFTATNPGLVAVFANISVTPTLGACVGAVMNFTIIVKPRPQITAGAPPNQTVCPGNVTIGSALTSNLVGTSYSWSNSNTAIGMASSSVGNTPAFAATNSGTVNISGTITITPSSGGCAGNPAIFTVTVKPNPTVLGTANQSYCAGSVVPATVLSSSPPGASFTWTNSFTYNIGLGNSGVGNIPSFTSTNPVTFQVTNSLVVTPTLNGCTGPNASYTVAIKNLPTVNLVSTKNVCNGTVAPPIVISSPSVGTTFNWTNSNPAIGVPAAGAGDIAGFMPVNPGIGTISSTVTVTPSLLGCVGPNSTFTINVKPSPVIPTPASLVICPNIGSPATALISVPAGASYNWTNDNAAIGLATAGVGNVPFFLAKNTTTANISGNITITPTLAGCAGTTVNYSVTVKPNPIVMGTANQVYCTGDNVPASNFTSVPPGATFTWTNGYTQFIGLGPSGAGNTPSFVAANPATFPVNGNLAITATLNGCAGPAANYTINVINKVTMNLVANQTFCDGAPVSSPAFTSPYAGVTYTWTNNNTSIGLGASGNGNTSAFTATNSTGAAIIGNVVITPTYNSCPGINSTYSITVKARITAAVPANQLLCDGSPVAATAFTSTPAGATFTWTNSNTAIGLGAGGAGNVPAFVTTNTSTSPISGTISVTPTLAGCVGIPSTYTISLKASPASIVPGNSSLCSGDNAAAVNFTSVPAGATFAWTNSNSAIGLSSSGAGAVPAFIATNAGIADINGTVAVNATLNGCTGPASNYLITVKPLPAMTALANQIVCTGANVPSSAFSSVPAGATFAWNNSNTAVGLAANGNGNLPPFVAVNATTAYVNSTITVTPTFNGCSGASSNYNISVAPEASLTAPTNQTFCAGAVVPVTNINSSPAGTTYTWTNSNPAIGLAAGGNGDVPSFVAGTAGAAVETATITLTPAFGGCNGNAVSYTITVKPLPQANVPLNQIICNGAAVPAANFTSVPGAATFAWTNNNTSIGLAANGSGNIAGFSAINSGSAPVVANITVTPTLNSCTGNASAYTITINPSPVVNPIANELVCNGAGLNAAAFTSNPAGATFSWTSSLSGIGLANSGNGDVPAFSAINAGASALVSTITVTPTLATCIGNSQTYTITVNPTPAAPTASGATICPGSTVSLTAAPLVGTIEWFDLPAAGTLQNSGPNFTTPVLMSSVSYYVQTTVNTCSSLRTAVNVTISNVLAVNAGLADTICEGNNTILQASPTGASYSYQWDAPANLNFSNSANPIVSPLTTTIYTLTVTKVGGCVGTSTVKIEVKPKPIVAALANQTVCNGSVAAAVSLTSIPAGANFVWTNSNTSINLAAGGSGNLPAFTAVNGGTSAQNANIVVTPTLNGCMGNSSNFNIQVDPSPGLVAPLSSSHCVGASIAATNLVSVPAGATFVWTNSNSAIGLAASGTGDVPAFTTANAGSSALTANISIVPTLNGCSGLASNYSITVKPTPVLVAPSNVTVCAGAQVSQITFSSNPAGAAFTWTNSNISISLAASGNGNISAFTTVNSGSTQQQAIIGVSPILNGCVGTIANFNINVDPIPVVTVGANQAVCNGILVAASNFSSVPAGASYAWTNSNTSIGLAANGLGNVPSFSSFNSGNSLQSATISIVPSLNGCNGLAATYTIDVKPSPVVVMPSNQSICNGANSTALALSSTPAGAAFAWINSTPSIGLAAIGSGNIPAFTAINSGSALVTSSIAITPTLAGCVGLPQNLIIDVHPTPVAPTVADQTVCVNTSALLTATAPGGNYQWFTSSTGGTPVHSGISYTTPQLAASALYYVQTTVAGCTSSRTQVNAFITGFFIASAGPDDSICNGASYLLQAIPNGAGYSCVWDEPSNPGFSNNFSVSITPSATKIYIARLTGPGGCVVSDTVKIKVNPVPTVSTPASLNLCDGATSPAINFITNPGNAVCTWTNSSPLVGLAAAGSGNISPFTVTNSGTTNLSANITITPSYRGCIGNINNFSIVAKPTPLITSILSDLVVCAGEILPTTAFITAPANSNIVWSNNNASIGLSANGSGDLPAFVTRNATGLDQTGIITVKPNFQGCFGNSGTFKINVIASPVADFSFSPDKPNNLNALVDFNQKSVFAQVYTWDFGDGNSSMESKPIHNYADTGCYRVQLIAENINGCKDSMYQDVCVESSYTLYIPNAFTPDGDDRNDSFKPVGFGIEDRNFEMIIFDRLGDEIFRSTSIQTGWDGNGTKGPYSMGGYVYKISCRDLQGYNHSYVGQVILIR